MEGDGGIEISENGDEPLIANNGEEVEKARGDENVLRFLDSLDGYLTLIDSLNSTLRQGWMDLASARHSMGALRVNSALLDLKVHPAATTVQVTEEDVDSKGTELHFSLSKWASIGSGKGFSANPTSKEDKPRSPQLRHRGISDNPSSQDEASVMADEEIKEERKKSLSVFGTLVSPKLRSSQLSFETAVETLVEIANMRSSLISAFERVNKELKPANQ
ncbi:PREDICTED: coiled-coil domain-containing protein 115 [Tarenaya hassleriana]|uniref:coiled-coil domain-containing protein 115 n=1 Tax=Tarenaya hassleriana TaxID=28532 RepID=UPI00053C74A7|nr:PREDICTED: coiled-coil domain-containing protein 115 [Tarenaya hassleriana]